MNPPTTLTPFKSLSLAEQRLKHVLPSMIGLERDEEVVVGEPLGQVFVRTDPSPLVPLVLASPTLLRVPPHRLPVSVRQLVGDAMSQLAIVRAWRVLDTEGPPASLVSTNFLWDALASTGLVVPQDLVDRIHLAINRGRPWWNPDDASRRKPLEGFSLLPAHRTGPTLTGYLAQGHVSITRYAAGRSISITPHPVGSGERRQYKAEIAGSVSETIALAAVGRRPRDVIDHPMLEALGGTVVGVRVSRDRTRMRVRFSAPPRRWFDAKQIAEFDLQRLQLLARESAVVREVLRSVGPR